MMPLERLLTLSDKEVQAWLVKVDKGKQIKTLVTALLGAGETVRERVFDNMSPKAVEALKGDIDKGHAKNIKTDEIIKAGIEERSGFLQN
jgi:flagellar motor switch protein FliG